MVAGIGPAGAATFALDIESGATVTYEWLTDVISSMSGLEQRVSWLTVPRQRYAFSTLLTDAQQRRVLSTLAGSAHEAPAFLLGLAHEELTVAASTTSTLTVEQGLALCDWAEPGQRIVVVGDAGMGEAVVQSTAGDTITIDVDLTAVAVPGARVMPAMGVRLDPRQVLSRYKVNLGRWDLDAWAERFRYGAAGIAGKGATVATYDGLPVWDWGIFARGLRDEPLYSGSELVDLGGVISGLQVWDRSQAGRQLRIESSEPEDWQWLKRFLWTVRGRWKAFLLPTGRPDLVPLSDASTGTLTVDATGMDYAADWYPSLAHRRLRIVLADGTDAYRGVVAVGGVGATQDLALDAPLAGVIDRVEMLETVRLESDTVEVRWDSAGFAVDLDARVVQR